MSNNITGVKISEFNVSNTIDDNAVLPFVSSATNLAITFANLKSALGVTGVIKSTGSASSVPLLDKPSSSLNYIRGVIGSQGVTTTLGPQGDVQIKTSLINDATGEGLIVNPNAAQIAFKSIVGGINTLVSTVNDTIVIDVEESDPLVSQKIVRASTDFDNPLNPNIQYFIDGSINMGETQLNIGPDGANISGLGFGVSELTSTANTYTLFNSAACGSLFINNVAFTISGASSQVFDLTDATGTNTVEMSGVNFNGCSSLGSLTSFRQGLEFNTGRFGGAPKLQLAGSMNGYRATTSIARGIADGTTLFEAGAGLTFSGRFVTDINADLAATGALLDFAPANITNNESLIINGAFVTRDGVINASDTTIYPNIDHKSVKSNWGNNTGLPNTKKYIKAICTTEVVTALSGQPISTYLPLEGTFTPEVEVQFDSPVNGQYRLLTGNGIYSINGTIQIIGTAGDVVDLRITLSQDDGLTFPTQVNHIGLEIPNYTGGNDFATFSVNFIQELKEGERIRLEVENNTAARNVTAGSQSFLIVTEV